VNGQNFGNAFFEGCMDAFALSWTTFSTVVCCRERSRHSTLVSTPQRLHSMVQGYGLVFPGTGATVVSNINHCTGVTLVASVETLVGIL
jgi:hypothetical protein